MKERDILFVFKKMRKNELHVFNTRKHFVPILEDEYAFLSWSKSASQVPSKQAEARWSGCSPCGGGKG